MQNKNNGFTEKFLKEEKIKVCKEHRLKDYTTIKTGGKAQFYYQPVSLKKLKKVFKFINDNNINYKIIGMGSNLLVSDKGVSGFVINLIDLPQKVNIGNSFVQISSNLNNKEFIAYCKKEGLGELEFLTGIPGSLGGMINMNAGAFDYEIGDYVQDISIINKMGKMQTINRDNISFEYRKISLPVKNYIIVSSRLKFTKKPSQKIEEKVKFYNSKRNSSNLNNYPTFGSVFKNGYDYHAGELIDKCGLKGYSLGGAEISELHANFILNKNNASAADIYKLIKLVEKRVKEKYNIELEPEVRFWGDFSYAI